MRIIHVLLALVACVGAAESKSTVMWPWDYFFGERKDITFTRHPFSPQMRSLSPRAHTPNLRSTDVEKSDDTARREWTPNTDLSLVKHNLGGGTFSVILVSE
uniref:Uncharacterized protein n=1 Tax=Noctiluca scintillans TaxID=2966 RepID=A0A7S1B2N8_NOCSC|mmetsp:Transcript_9482/g.26493  ORF Transcript_9482/g.26493 Transcript_9482/m.26493 type:complete len:102 (+) Transcript_9482:78-383(+)